jgi:hypothetical protein
VPDVFEGATTVSQSTQFVVDGKTYGSLDELPPEARQRYEQAMGQFDKNRDGVPDVLESLAGLTRPAQPDAAPAAASSPAIAPAHSTAPHVTVVGEGRGPRAAWLIAIAAIVLLAGAVVFLLLTR